MARLAHTVLFVSLFAMLGACEAAYAQTPPRVPTTDASVSTSSDGGIASAVVCASDADCGWDDPCSPRTCVAAHPRDPHRHCGRPSTPGACHCIAGLCSTTRNERQREADPAVACTRAEDCGYDPSHGACVPTAQDTVGHAVTEGIACTCDGHQHRCVQTWRGDVPCQSWRDCALEYGVDGHTHVAPSWFTPRSFDHPARPCRDASHDAVCRGGSCRMIGWRC